MIKIVPDSSASALEAVAVSISGPDTGTAESTLATPRVNEVSPAIFRSIDLFKSIGLFKAISSTNELIPRTYEKLER
jgi:hypothetical protein